VKNERPFWSRGQAPCKARRDPVRKAGIAFAYPLVIGDMEGVMAHTIAARRLFGEILGFFEHFAIVVLGFVLMVVGLGLGVTMIMLPVGLVLGLAGMGLFIAGIFGHLDKR
jgi:hypothetical protein